MPRGRRAAALLAPAHGCRALRRRRLTGAPWLPASVTRCAAAGRLAHVWAWYWIHTFLVPGAAGGAEPTGRAALRVLEQRPLHGSNGAGALGAGAGARLGDPQRDARREPRHLRPGARRRTRAGDARGVHLPWLRERGAARLPDLPCFVHLEAEADRCRRGRRASRRRRRARGESQPGRTPGIAALAAGDRRVQLDGGRGRAASREPRVHGRWTPVLELSQGARPAFGTGERTLLLHLDGRGRCGSLAVCHDGQDPHRAEPDGRSARRHRLRRAVQLRPRPQARRPVRPAHRGHRPRAQLAAPARR